MGEGKRERESVSVYTLIEKGQTGFSGDEGIAGLDIVGLMGRPGKFGSMGFEVRACVHMRLFIHAHTQTSDILHP